MSFKNKQELLRVNLEKREDADSLVPYDIVKICIYTHRRIQQLLNDYVHSCLLFRCKFSCNFFFFFLNKCTERYYSLYYRYYHFFFPRHFLNCSIISSLAFIILLNCAIDTRIKFFPKHRTMSKTRVLVFTIFILIRLK